MARVGGVYPVVDAEPQVRDAPFRVEFPETGVEHLPDVGLAVAIGVFHEENVGSAGDNQTALPGHQAADFEHLVGEDDAAVDFAVAVRIFEQPDAGARGLARRGIVRIVEHLGDVDPAVFVEGHFNGIEHLRLGGEQLDMEVLAEVEALQGVLRRESRGSGLFLRTGQKGQQRHQQDGFQGGGHSYTL